MTYGKKRWLAVIVSVLLLAGCGGGGSGGHDSPSSQTNSPSTENGGAENTGGDNSENSGGNGDVSLENAPIMNISHIENIEKMGSNTLATRIKWLEIEHIAVQEIGDTTRNYQLETKEIDSDELNEIGGDDANLSNKDAPVVLENGTFYRVQTSFNVIGTYSEGANFTVSLVSTDKEEPFTMTLGNSNVIIEEEGDGKVKCDVLVPVNMPEGDYLLVVALSNADISSFMQEKKKITEIPQIGAIYVKVAHKEFDRTVSVLDINTTRYMDVPYSMRTDLLFHENYMNRANGTGKFLFSNIGTKDITVLIRAKLRLINGKYIDLGLLDPKDNMIKKEIAINVPHTNENKVMEILKGLYDISPTIPHFTPQGKVVAEEKKKVTFQPTNVSPGIEGLKVHHVFIPFVGVGLKGERRYRATVSYYIPKDSYKDVVSVLPDLSLNGNTQASKGGVVWEVTLIDRRTIKEMTSGVDMIKFKDATKDSYAWLHGAFVPSLIEKFTKPIDAALDMPDGTAYAFFGDMCAKIDRDTGKAIGEWKKTIDVFKGGPIFFSYKITAAFRIGDIAYFFFDEGKKEAYIAYSLSQGKVLLADKIRNFDKKRGIESNIASCIDSFQGNGVDAAFNDYGEDNIYLISKQRYVKLHKTIKSNKTYYECTGGELKDIEAWSSIAGEPITAVLSDHYGKGKLRFYINGFSSKIVLNKPNLFIDKHDNVDKELGDSDIISLRCKINYGVEARWFVPQARGYTNAYLDFYLFNSSFSLFLLEADAYSGVNKIHPYIDAVEVKTKSGAKLLMKILGSTYVDEGAIQDVTITAKLEVGEEENKFVSKEEKRLYEGEIAEWHTKDTLFKARFPVGPILLAVSGGVEGDMTINSPIDQVEEGIVGAKISVTPSVKASVGVFADGGVDYDLVKAGVEADITLSEVGANGELAGTLAFTGTAIKFDVTTKADAYLNLIRASFSFYAGTKTHIEWCKSWGIPYPCGLGWDVWDIPVYTTPWLFSDDVTFFNKTLYSDEIPLF